MAGIPCCARFPCASSPHIPQGDGYCREGQDDGHPWHGQQQDEGFFADILVLQRNFDFGFALLRKAVENTFARYGVSMPEQIPMCFSSDFANSPMKQRQWTAFISKAEIKDLPAAFSDVMRECSAFLLPLLVPSYSSPGKWMAEQGRWIA